MDAAEIRMRCLELAARHHDDVDAVISEAETLVAFVGSAPEPARHPSDNGRAIEAGEAARKQMRKAGQPLAGE